MDFKGTVFTSILLATVLLLAWFAWDQYKTAKALADYASELEGVYDTLQTVEIENTELKVINGKRLDDEAVLYPHGCLRVVRD